MYMMYTKGAHNVRKHSHIVHILVQRLTEQMHSKIITLFDFQIVQKIFYICLFNILKRLGFFSWFDKTMNHKVLKLFFKVYIVILWIF